MIKHQSQTSNCSYIYNRVRRCHLFLVTAGLHYTRALLIGWKGQCICLEGGEGRGGREGGREGREGGREGGRGGEERGGGEEGKGGEGIPHYLNNNLT